MQGSLWDEDAATAEGSGRLGNRDRAKARHITDKPEAIQKTAGLDGPGWTTEIVSGPEVLGESAEVGIETRITDQLRAL